MGLEPIVAPLFTVRALAWTPPDPARFDAVLLTSANAARHGGDGMTPFLALPCYAVGERTAAAARSAGFAEVAYRARRMPRPCSRWPSETAPNRCFTCAAQDHVASRSASRSVPVYAAEPSGALPPDVEQALVLLHSPRAAARFAVLAGDRRGAIRHRRDQRRDGARGRRGLAIGRRRRRAARPSLAGACRQAVPD